MEKLLIWRPTPLHRAYALEKALETPARIYYKNEGVQPPGKPQTQHRHCTGLLQQSFGIKRIATETGAGQWGSAISFACCLFGLECKVYMVRISYDQKPYRRLMMNTWGAHWYPSPSKDTNAGRKILEEPPILPEALASRSAKPLKMRSPRRTRDTPWKRPKSCHDASNVKRLRKKEGRMSSF